MLDNTDEDGFHGGKDLLQDDEDDGKSTSVSMNAKECCWGLPRTERVVQGYRDGGKYQTESHREVLLWAIRRLDRNSDSKYTSINPFDGVDGQECPCQGGNRTNAVNA